MIRNLKKLLATLLCCMVVLGSLSVLAEEVWIGDVRYYIKEDEGCAYATFLSSNAVDVTIEKTVQGYPVTTIWYNCAYSGAAKTIKKLTILADIIDDEGVTQGAFSNSSVEEVVYNDSTIVGMGMFNGCASLKSVQLPSKLKQIGSHAFQNCTSLTSIVIPASVDYIGAEAFAGCTSLKKVTFLGDIDFMHWPSDTAFKDCPNLTIHGKIGAQLELYAESCGIPYDDGTIKPNTIKITNGKSAELQVKKTLKLNTKLTPSKAQTTLIWTSSDVSVVKVSNKGLVTAVKKGAATVTVTTKNGKTASIKIKVVAQKPRKVEIINGKKATLKVGEKLALKTKLIPEGAETKLSWKSSDKRIATVDKNGVITAKKAGTAKITVSTSNGKTAKIKITVKK